MKPKKIINLILAILSLLTFNENFSVIYLNIIGIASFIILMKINDAFVELRNE